MKITPRKHEVEALLSVLDGYPPAVVLGVDPHLAAERLLLGKALVKAAWASFMDREFWVYAFRLASGLTARYGPFTSAVEAERFAQNMAIDARGSHVVAKVYGPAPGERLFTYYPAAEASS